MKIIIESNTIWYIKGDIWIKVIGRTLTVNNRCFTILNEISSKYVFDKLINAIDKDESIDISSYISTYSI